MIMKHFFIKKFWKGRGKQEAGEREGGEEEWEREKITGRKERKGESR